MGAANSKGEAVFPRAGRFKDTPIVFVSYFSNPREWVDEGFVPAEIKEGEVGFGITVSGDPAGDSQFLEAAHFFEAFVVFADHVGKKFDVFSPVEASSEREVKSQSLSDFLNPEFGAGGREDQGLALVFLGLDFGKDFGVADLGQPFADEILRVFFDGVGLHFPELGVEDPFHAARTQNLVERQKSEEDGGKQSPERFTVKNEAPKHQLGVPGDDRLIEVVEDELFGFWHWKGNLRLV